MSKTMRKGLGRGLGMGYKNLMPMDSHIHSLSAKGVKTILKVPQVIKKKDYWINIQESGEAKPIGIIVDVFDKEDELLDTYPILYDDFDNNKKKTLKFAEVLLKKDKWLKAKGYERPDRDFLSVKETGDKLSEELDDLKLPDVKSVVRDDFNSSSGDIFINIKGEEFGLNYALGEEPTKFNIGRVTRKVRSVLDKWKKEGKISGYKMYVPEKKYDSYGSYDGYEESSIEIEYWV